MLTKQPATPGRPTRVTFELPAGVHAGCVHLVGDFNNWDTRANPMEHDGATGAWRAHLTLPAGRRYRFRYLVDGHEWLNDWYADDHVENPYGSYDSVLDLTRPRPNSPIPNPQSPLPAIFFDRDGVINRNRPDYVKTWEEVVFLPGVFPALARLAAAPYKIVLVTNQSPIGRGILTAAQVEDINARLVAEIQAHGGRVDAVYYCPHHPDAGCACRKPRPGLLLAAARDLDLDLARSYLVGDAASDVQAALAAGAAPILVLTGRGAAQRSRVEQLDPPPLILPDLPAAVTHILSHPL